MRVFVSKNKNRHFSNRKRKDCNKSLVFRDAREPHNFGNKSLYDFKQVEKSLLPFRVLELILSK